MFDSNIIAKIIIVWCRNNNVSITNERLQKFLYLVNYEYIKEYKVKLINESFCCLRSGPVIQSIYVEYAIYGAEEIAISINNIKLDTNILFFVCNAMEKYKHMSTSELIRICRESIPFKYIVDMFGYNVYIPTSLDLS
jgi:uncharacterized phage-associated protein